MTTVTRGDVGMERGAAGEASEPEELLYPIRRLYTGIEGKLGCTVKWELSPDGQGHICLIYGEFPFLFVSMLHTPSKRQSRR